MKKPVKKKETLSEAVKRLERAVKKIERRIREHDKIIKEHDLGEITKIDGNLHKPAH